MQEHGCPAFQTHFVTCALGPAIDVSPSSERTNFSRISPNRPGFRNARRHHCSNDAIAPQSKPESSHRVLCRQYTSFLCMPCQCDSHLRYWGGQISSTSEGDGPRLCPLRRVGSQMRGHPGHIGQSARGLNDCCLHEIGAFMHIPPYSYHHRRQ